jgi:hypothetical protein
VALSLASVAEPSAVAGSDGGRRGRG